MTDDGLRHHYFEQGIASPGDHMLKQAISQGVVPKGCLMGGHIVMGFSFAKQDPCTGCDGPREKCGGRPKGHQPVTRTMERGAYPEDMIEKPTNTSPEIRGEFRRVIRFGLDRLSQDALEEREKKKDR